MNTTQTKFGREAKDKLKKGIQIINDAVASTMGPFGRNVLYKNDYGTIQSTKDGVSVAKMIKSVGDKAEDFGVQIIKQASIKTVEQAGDGTTTSTVLAHSIASQALDITYNDVNVTEVRKGIENTVNTIINLIKQESKPVLDEKQIKQIATLSANGDAEIGNLVTESLNKVGNDGVVTVEESRTGETSLEVVEGIQFDRGYKSPYFVTNNNTMQCVMQDSLILLYDKRISQAKDLLPILESVAQQNKSLTIIAEDISDEALSLLIVNKMRGSLRTVVIKAPDFGERRQLILEDIAIITGGTVVSPDKGMKLDKFNQDWFGQARTITVSRDTTTIVDGNGDDDKIKNRILELKEQMENTQTLFDREKLQERIAKLVGGVAIINVGGGNETEIKEKKDRVDDALNATKAAIEEGISPGCGVALLNAVSQFEKTNLNKNKSKDYILGQSIVLEACSTPFKQILKNAGINHSKWINKVGGNKVLNFETLQLTDAIESGIIDPTKVIRCALKNATSAAVTLLLTECILIDIEDKNEKDNLSEYSM